MNLEQRIIELEKTINLLLEKDKRQDTFNDEILNAVKVNNNLIVGITDVQLENAQILQSTIDEIKKIATK
jgi:hypothetical protein